MRRNKLEINSISSPALSVPPPPASYKLKSGEFDHFCSGTSRQVGHWTYPEQETCFLSCYMLYFSIANNMCPEVFEDKVLSPFFVVVSYLGESASWDEGRSSNKY